MSTDDKPKKPKLVRDSFTIPKAEYAAIDALKTRAIGLGSSVKKSELLRAGLMLLLKSNDAAFKAALAQVPSLKTGRPAAQDQVAPAAEKSTPAKAPAKPQAKTAVKAPVKASVTTPVKAPIKAPVKTPVAKKAAPPRSRPATKKVPAKA